MIAIATNEQKAQGSLKGFWRGWAWPLSMGLASGALIVAIIHEPARDAELAVSAPLCRVLDEGGWMIEPSPDGTCRIVASYRKRDRFWRLVQGDRTIQANAAEILAVRGIRR
jgi:hypothetical protein